VTNIGITQRCLPPTEFGERRYALDARWFLFLAACGLTPVPLPNDPTIALDTVTAFGIDGIVLSGGDDLAAYGGTCPERDATELRLLEWALRHDRPVWGVCRGMQLIVHAFGGTLEPVDGHVATRHPVRIDGVAREVNSYHRLAPRAVPDPLLVTATCGDVVEGVRHRDARVRGVLWHAERETPFAAADVASVRDFFGGAR
jgi:gamma-glutamyl-gamma-aminobutyrate hydrolase PuuD